MLMKKILITGGAGYIGSHVAKYMALEGYSIHVIDNLSTGNEWALKWGSSTIGDIRDKTLLRKVFSSFKPDSVIHFAAKSIVSESQNQPEEYFENNVTGTEKLLEVMSEFDVKNIVFSSTCAVYGIPKGDLNENHSREPLSVYGETKKKVENLLKNFHISYDINYIALRYFNAAGADPEGEIGELHEPETHLIPNVIRAIATKSEVSIFGRDYNTPDGTCIRDYIHVQDLASAHILATEKLLSDGFAGPINLGTGNGASVLDIIHAVENVTGQKVKTQNMPRRQGDPDILVAFPKLAKDVLGWLPKHSNIQNIIQDAYNWQMSIENKI